MSAEHGLDDAGETRRWGLSAALVLAAHLVPLTALALWLKPALMVPPPPPTAVMIDMSPAKPAPAPQPQPEQKPRPVVTQQTPKAVTLPRLPTVANAAVTLPADPPRQPSPAPPTTATAAPPAAPPQASSPPTPPSNALPNWQGQVLGRLEKFKQYPEDARFHHQQGVAYLRFTMNRQGQVLSASIDRSSGNAALDAEALALVRRAQPLPKPPADVPGDRLELVAPIEFSLTNH